MNGLLGILQKNDLCFWGTRFDSLNDPTEVKFAKNIVLPALCRSLQDTPYEQQTEEVELNNVFPYIVSFSKSCDDLNMWRLYNAEIALILDRSLLENIQSDNHPAILKDVEYAESEDSVSQIAVKLFNDAIQSKNIVETFNMCVFPFIKNKAYEIEKEVRLVGCDFMGFSTNLKNGEVVFDDHEMPVNVNCRGTRNGYLLLYKEFHVCKEALRGILVNEQNDNKFARIKNQLRIWLLNNDYSRDLPIKQTESWLFVDTLH